MRSIFPKMKSGLIVILALTGLIFIFGLSAGENSLADLKNASYPELQELAIQKLDFSGLSKYFIALAETKGAEYAYEILKTAPIPPDIDMHLLGHVVGDELYKQQGADGIKICTQDFRNACSHSIVVGLLLAKGEAAMPEISKACQEAPGGSGAYTMCFHGLGHGVLAYVDYEIPDAIKICNTTGTSAHYYREAAECIGGGVMEIVGGGFHDPELWKIKSAKYLPHDNPLYICMADFMPIQARTLCLLYLTPHFFKATGGDLGHPTEDSVTKAFKVCEDIPANNISDRDACFGGFGKDFIGIAAERDIRNIGQMPTEKLQKIYDWCKLTDDEQGLFSCVITAAGSLYWGGENDRGAVIRFCGLIDKPDLQYACFSSIIGAVGFYIKDPSYKESFCNEIPATYGNECRDRLQI